MTDDREGPTRRAVLGASVACLSAGVAGCSRYRRDSDVGTPGDQEVRIDVTVRGPEGEGLADEPVVLVDTGGTTDTQAGRTDGDGRVAFIEGVGPPPCNTQFVALPDRGLRREAGCNEGGTTDEVEFRLEEGDADPPRPADDPPGDQEVRITVTVLDGGDPVADQPLVLQDRGGTPDTRYGITDDEGREVFFEGVGPPPCNTQFVELPDHGIRREVGCHDGAETASVEIDLDEAGNDA